MYLIWYQKIISNKPLQLWYTGPSSDEFKTVKLWSKQEYDDDDGRILLEGR